jgi:hypothetical protein
MSSGQGPVYDPNQPSSGSRGCLAAFLIVLGIALLLPGLCYLALGRAGGSNVAATGVLYSLAGVVLMICAGALLISRGPRPPPPPPPKLPGWPRKE